MRLAMTLAILLCWFIALIVPGAALEPPTGTHDFSCDSSLTMHYRFDDPLNPGLDSVSGKSAGLTGDVTVANGVVRLNGGAVRLEPLTVGPGDDITFTWHMKPEMSSTGTSSFRIGRNFASEPGRIQFWSGSGSEWFGTVKLPSSDWIYGGVGPGTIPLNSPSWVFVAWRIRSSDGFWSITVDDNEVYSGVTSKLPEMTFDNEWHHVGTVDTSPFFGLQNDFRIYHAYLSDSEVAAVRAGGPASECAAPVDFSCDAGLVMRYPLNDQALLGEDRVSGNTAGVTGSVTVHDSSHATFNGGGVRLEPFTVSPGDSFAFSFWIYPDSSTRTSSIQDVIRLRKAEQSSEGAIQIRWSTTDSSKWGFHMKREDDTVWNSVEATISPDKWSFVLWQIRADGEWRVFVNDAEVFKGVRQPLFPGLYDGRWHDLAFNAINPNGWTLTTFYGSLRDFRVYRSASLSDAQVASIRAGGPASECAGVTTPSLESTPRPGFTYKKRVVKVKTIMSVPLTVEEFTEDAQREYRETVAVVTGVTVDAVSIISISPE
jgi:hypothetical protein